MTLPVPTHHRKGFACALLAFLAWGLVTPVYIKALHKVPVAEILVHRGLWGGVMMLAFVMLAGKFTHFRSLLQQRRVLLWLAVTSTLLFANWSVYIWAVTESRIVEASLGYFMNPLVSVLLGFAVLGERLKRIQILAVLLAAASVLWLTLQQGSPPWIPLFLAVTFAFYGLIRKKLAVEAVPALAVELLLAMPFLALPLLLWTMQGTTAFGHVNLTTDLLCLGAGAITALPLIFYGIATRHLRLAEIGLMQYLAPTLQMLTGVFLYHEPFTHIQQVAFGGIWLALALYSGSSLYGWRRQQVAV